MELHFTAEQEAQLAELAAHCGCSPEAIVRNAALHLIKKDRHFIEAVQKGEAALDRGESLTHQEVGERLGLLLNR